MHVLEVAEIRAVPLDIELSEPFGIAGGAQLRAANVLVTLRLSDGNLGLGEGAPFPAVSGETQLGTLQALEQACPALLGVDAGRWRHFAALGRECLAHAPAALAALESALLDALCRAAGLSLWRFFGGAERALSTDITIPTGSVQSAREATLRAQRAGFATLKIKVGGAPLEHDAARVQAVAAQAAEARLVLDANASLSAEQALELLSALGPARARVVLFEQPTAADDSAGLRKVRERSGVAVAADESARSARDVAQLAREAAVDVINVKIMKSGVAEALDMIQAARAAGLGLMVGGMVESQLAMSVSACLAAGVGGFSHVDLDTPLFMRDAPFEGGFVARGAELSVDGIALGHGVGLRGR